MKLADKLRPHIEALQSAAASGDSDARQVINLYQMHVRCPSDPGAPALCEAAFDAWLPSQENRNEAG